MVGVGCLTNNDSYGNLKHLVKIEPVRELPVRIHTYSLRLNPMEVCMYVWPSHIIAKHGSTE